MQMSVTDSIRRLGIHFLTTTDVETDSSYSIQTYTDFENKYVFAFDNRYWTIQAAKSMFCGVLTKEGAQINWSLPSAQLRQFLGNNENLYVAIARLIDVRHFKTITGESLKTALVNVYIDELKKAAFAAITRKKHRKQHISHLLRRQVWAKHIGEEIGKTKCMCCKLSDITQLTFICGHIVAESKGGSTTVDNLIPICQHCNLSMGTQNMYSFMERHSTFRGDYSFLTNT